MSALAPNDPRHGSVNGYNNLGCRCDACREAWRVAWTERAHRTGRHAPRESLIRHGIKRYSKGCRCDTCRAAKAAEKRRYRARHPEAVARENEARMARYYATRAAS